VKFLLNVYVLPASSAGPGEPDDHEAFLSSIRDSGELISDQVIADPSTSAVVRVRDGVITVFEGTYPQAGAYIARCYLVDCETRERALELAGRVPYARFGGVEVRPLMVPAGMEM
jgi:hypothetical protein